jgi:hypothetical protein
VSFEPRPPPRQVVLDRRSRSLVKWLAMWGRTALLALPVVAALVAATGPARAQARCEVASFDADASVFRLDANGNGAWDGPAGGDRETRLFADLGPGVPVVGDWNGDGQDDVGKQVGTVYALDLDGDGVWEGAAGGDRSAHFAAAFGAGVPIVGDWDGDGADEIGTFVPEQKLFVLDVNGDGVWGGEEGGDHATRLFGSTTPVPSAALPLIGDWNLDGKDDVGWSENARVLQDRNGNGRWDGTAGGDIWRNLVTLPDAVVAARHTSLVYAWIAAVSGFRQLEAPVFSLPSRFAAFTGVGKPLLCDWAGNGNGLHGRGKVVDGTRFFLDRDANGVWLGDAAGDQTAVFDTGVPGQPLAGRWLPGEPP